MTRRWFIADKNIYILKIYTQDIYTRYNYTQDIHTRYIHKIYTQDIYTGYIPNIQIDVHGFGPVYITLNQHVQ